MILQSVCFGVEEPRGFCISELLSGVACSSCRQCRTSRMRMRCSISRRGRMRLHCACASECRGTFVIGPSLSHHPYSEMRTTPADNKRSTRPWSSQKSDTSGFAGTWFRVDKPTSVRRNISSRGHPIVEAWCCRQIPQISDLEPAQGQKFSTWSSPNYASSC